MVEDIINSSFSMKNTQYRMKQIILANTRTSVATFVIFTSSFSKLLNLVSCSSLFYWDTTHSDLMRNSFRSDNETVDTEGIDFRELSDL